MNPEVEAKVSGPGIGMIVVGVLHILYGLAMGLWSMWPIMMVLISALSEGEFGVLLMMIVPMLQVVAYVVVGICGVVAIFGGVKMRSATGKGIVYAGVGAGAVAPLIALATAAINVLNVAGGCCCAGMAISGGLAIPGLLGGIGVAAWVVMTLGDEAVAAAFDAE